MTTRSTTYIHTTESTEFDAYPNDHEDIVFKVDTNAVFLTPAQAQEVVSVLSAVLQDLDVTSDDNLSAAEEATLLVSPTGTLAYQEVA